MCWKYYVAFFFFYVSVVRLSFLVSFCCSYCWKCFFPTCWYSHLYVPYIRRILERFCFFYRTADFCCRVFSASFLCRAKTECRTLNAGDFVHCRFIQRRIFPGKLFFFDVGIFETSRRTKATSEFAKKTPYQLDICRSIFRV